MATDKGAARQNARFNRNDLDSLRTLKQVMDWLTADPPMSLRECANHLKRPPAWPDPFLAAAEKAFECCITPLERQDDNTSIRVAGLTEAGRNLQKSLGDLLALNDRLDSHSLVDPDAEVMRIGGTNTSLGLVLPVFLDGWTLDLSRQVRFDLQIGHTADELLYRLARGDLEAVVAPPGSSDYGNQPYESIDLEWGLIYARNDDYTDPWGDRDEIRLKDLPPERFLLASTYRWLFKFVPRDKPHVFCELPSVQHAINWTRRRRGKTIGHGLHMGSSKRLAWKKIEFEGPCPSRPQILLYVPGEAKPNGKPRKPLTAAQNKVAELIQKGMRAERDRLVSEGQATPEA